MAEGGALERAVELAQKVAALPATAVAVTKSAIDAAADAPRDAAVLIERLAYGLLAQTDAARKRRRRLHRRLMATHEKEIEIRWRDLDVYGHVNHVVFLTYLEEARDEWLGSTLGDPAKVWDYVVARVADRLPARSLARRRRRRRDLPAREHRHVEPADARGDRHPERRAWRPSPRRCWWRATPAAGRSRPLTDAERASLERALPAAS